MARCLRGAEARSSRAQRRLRAWLALWHACAASCAEPLVELRDGHLVVALSDATVPLRPGGDVYVCALARIGAAVLKRHGPLVTSGQFATFTRTPETHAYVHHITILECPARWARKPNGYENATHFPCALSPLRLGCPTEWVNSDGQTADVMPAGYGQPVPALALIQVHFKAPAGTSRALTLRDSTGLRVPVQPRGRLREAALLGVGSRTGMLHVPPGEAAYRVSSVCAARCIARALASARADHFDILRVSSHMHRLGVKTAAEIVHADGSATPLMVETDALALRDADGRFKAPTPPLARPVRLRATDALQVTCVYDSRARTRETRLGVPFWTHEMCYAFVLLTPAAPRFSSCQHFNWDATSNRGLRQVPSAPCWAMCQDGEAWKSALVKNSTFVLSRRRFDPTLAAGIPHRVCEAPRSAAARKLEY